MSTKVTEWCWEHSEATGTDRLVLIAIGDQANHEGLNAYPSYVTLARRCRVSVKTVQRSVQKLEALGELAVDRRAGPAREGRTNQRPNVYSFPAFRISAGHETRQDVASLGKAATSEAKEATSEAGRRDKSSRRGDTVVTSDPSFDPSDSDPSFDPSAKPSSPASRSTNVGPPSEDLFTSSETQDPELDSSSREQDQGQHGGDQHLATVKESSTVTAQDVIAKWVDAYRESLGEKPTKQRIQQVGREAKQLLDAGRDPRKVLYAAKTAATSGYPTIVREYDRLVLAHQGRSQGVDPRPSTTDQRVAQALALAAKYEALDAAENELPQREAMYVPSTRI